MASPCGFLVSSWYQPPRRSRHLPSYSSSANTWTSCDQPQQHATHPQPHPQWSPGLDPHIPAAGHHTLGLVATIEQTAQSNHPHGQNTIAMLGQQVTVSADRVKPAYIWERTQHDTGSPPAQPRPAALQWNQSHRPRLQELCASGALCTSWLVSPPRLSSLGGGIPTCSL